MLGLLIFTSNLPVTWLSSFQIAQPCGVGFKCYMNKVCDNVGRLSLSIVTGVLSVNTYLVGHALLFLSTTPIFSFISQLRTNKHAPPYLT